MVNVIIYLEKDFDAEELVKSLLSAKLIASAVIDINNISYTMVNNQFCKRVYSVITAKSKSLLINNIIREVDERINGDVLISATPIVGSNKNFDDLVKQNTIPV
jgi:uncharacterized protein involved in tolerance to divalent cations